MRGLARAAVLTGLAAGCVSRGRFGALEGHYDDAVAARDRANAELDACRSAAALSSAAAEADRAAREAPDRALREAFAALAGRTGAVDEGLALRWDPSAWFEPGTADPTPALDPAAAALGPSLAGLAEARFVFTIATPDVPPANAVEFPSPWHLAADRAVAVVRALVAAGLPADRISAAAASGPDRATLRALR